MPDRKSYSRAVIDPHEVAEHRLRAADQRYTRNHRAVVESLQSAGRPLTLPELLKRRRGDLAQSSAYRSLSVLESADIVHRVTGAGAFARYELAQELTSHHHHQICEQCGAVEDFSLSAAVETTVEAALFRIARRNGFTPTSHHLDLLGRCERCG